MRRALAAVVAVVLVLTACGSNGGDSAQGNDLTFATGRQGGSQYPISVAITKVLEGTPSVGNVTLTPGGGTANVAAVNNGQAEIGITLSMSAVDGSQGNEPFKEPLTNVTHLFSLHPFNLVILTSADSPIDSVQDLRGKTVNVGPSGFTTPVVAKILFQDVYGFQPDAVQLEHLEITDAVDQFKNGRLDALLYLPSDRYAPYLDLAQARDIKVVPIDKEHRQKLLDAHPAFYKTTWPTKPGIYQGLDEPVPTVGISNTIIASKEEVSEKLGYRMAKSVAEHFGKVQAVEPSLKVLKPRDLAQPVRGMPVHPGAKRYFKEQGWTP